MKCQYPQGFHERPCGRCDVCRLLDHNAELAERIDRAEAQADELRQFYTGELQRVEAERDSLSDQVNQLRAALDAAQASIEDLLGWQTTAPKEFVDRALQVLGQCDDGDQQ